MKAPEMKCNRNGEAVRYEAREAGSVSIWKYGHFEVGGVLK